VHGTIYNWDDHPTTFTPTPPNKKKTRKEEN